MALLRVCPVCGRMNPTATCPEHQGSGQRRGSTRQWRRLRAWVIERDGGRCTRSGCDSSVGLEVHHVDRNHRNNDSTNLVTLCADHHAEAEGRETSRV